MIPAPNDLVALYRDKMNGREYEDEIPIIAIEDDGTPLVVGRNRRLVPADTYDNYIGLEQGPASRIVALLPAGGWRVEHALGDGSVFSEPLVGWGLKANGDIEAQITDPDGYVIDLHSLSGKWRVYHPDSEDSPGRPDPSTTEAGPDPSSTGDPSLSPDRHDPSPARR